MLHLAVGSGDFDTAALLIGFIKVNDYTHNLPLHHFVNAKDGNGLTALHRAILSPPKKGAEEKDAKIIQLLVENGSQLDEQTYDMGWTALHFACRMGDEAAVEALVSSGANSSIKDVRERTALDIAVEYGHPSFIFLIPTTAFDQDHYGMFFIGMEGEAAPSITTSNQFDINQDIIDLYSSTVGDEEEGEREKSAVARGGMKRKAGRPRITAKKSRPRSDAFDITTRPTKKSRKEEEEE